MLGVSLAYVSLLSSLLEHYCGEDTLVCCPQVGQAQGGFMGTMQRAMSRAEHHIWFQRSESRDRLAVAKR